MTCWSPYCRSHVDRRRYEGGSKDMVLVTLICRGKPSVQSGHRGQTRERKSSVAAWMAKPLLALNAKMQRSARPQPPSQHLFLHRHHLRYPYQVNVLPPSFLPQNFAFEVQWRFLPTKPSSTTRNNKVTLRNAPVKFSTLLIATALQRNSRISCKLSSRLPQRPPSSSKT